MKFILIIAVLFLSACGAQLRKPFCEETVSEIPIQFAGTFEVALPSTSPTWSNNTLLGKALVKIDKKTIQGPEQIPVFATSSRLCLVENRFLLEQRNSNGTYSLSEFSKFDQGVIISTLSLDVEAAQKKGMMIHYLPTTKVLRKDEAVFDLVPDENPFILDNTGLGPKEVLSVMTPMSYQVILREVAVTENFIFKTKVKITEHGFVF